MRRYLDHLVIRAAWFLALSVFAMSPLFMFSQTQAAYASGPVRQGASTEELNEYKRLVYEKELRDWQALPDEYSKYQAIQLVKHNASFGAYETAFVTLGRIGRAACLRTLDAAKEKYGKGTYIRCLTSIVEIRPPDIDSDYYTLDLWSASPNARVTYGIDQLDQCHKRLRSSSGRTNLPSSSQKFDFSKEACLISRQSLSGGELSLLIDKPARHKPRPVLKSHPSTESNAVFRGGIVCQLTDGIDDIAVYRGEKEYKDSREMYGVRDVIINELVDTSEENKWCVIPTCYELSAGTPVFADKSSHTFSLATYYISFYLKEKGGFVLQQATTLPENVIFNNNRSTFERNK